MAQCHLFYDLAIGFGSVIPGIILERTGNDYSMMFLSTTAVGTAGLVLFLIGRKRHPTPSEKEVRR